jgi:hypothetical protein
MFVYIGELYCNFNTKFCTFIDLVASCFKQVITSNGFISGFTVAKQHQFSPTVQREEDSHVKPNILGGIEFQVADW